MASDVSPNRLDVRCTLSCSVHAAAESEVNAREMGLGTRCNKIPQYRDTMILR